MFKKSRCHLLLYDTLTAWVQIQDLAFNHKYKSAIGKSHALVKFDANFNKYFKTRSAKDKAGHQFSLTAAVKETHKNIYTIQICSKERQLFYHRTGVTLRMIEKRPEDDLLFEHVVKSKVGEKPKELNIARLTRGVDLTKASLSNMKKAASKPGRKPLAPGFKAQKAFTRKAVINPMAHKAKIEETADLRINLVECVRRGASIAVTRAYKLAGIDLKSEERPQKMTFKQEQ